MKTLINSNNLLSTLFLVGFALIFVLAPFYSHPNLGWPSLALKYNTTSWSVAACLIAAALISISTSKKFSYPLLWPYFLTFPVIVILSSLFSDINQPIAWLFRLLFICAGLLFLFALFQARSKQSTLDNGLLIISIATSSQALLSAFQILAPEALPLWLPLNPGFTPRGMFQQVNVLASFLATGLVITAYIISRPAFRFSTLPLKVYITLSFPLTLYVIVASGSRVGLLSILLSIPLLLWSRRKQLKPHKKFLAIMFLASCGAFFAGQSGLHRTIDKTTQLADASYSTARIAMYTIGLELIEKKPLTGYGIGNFLLAWNKQASDFIQRHPDAAIPMVTTHPHNEILFWMVEGGLLVVIGIFAVIIGIILALKHCGFQRGGAYAALLIPISLHTQVEHPMHTSSLHWFLWLFLIYLPLRHQVKTTRIKLSSAATRSIQVLSISFALLTAVFMNNTDRAEMDLFSFLYDKEKQAPYLQLALNNIYTRSRAENIAMRSNLYASIEQNERKKIQTFITWAEEKILINPGLKMHEDLISAYAFLTPKEGGCKMIARSLNMYAQNKALQKANTACQSKKGVP